MTGIVCLCFIIYETSNCMTPRLSPRIGLSEALHTHNMLGGWSLLVPYISWVCQTESLNFASPFGLGFYTAGWLGNRQISQERDSGETTSSFITLFQMLQNITSNILFSEAITKPHWVKGGGKSIHLLMRPVTFWSETRNIVRDNFVKYNLPRLISFYEFIVKKRK